MFRYFPSTETPRGDRSGAALPLKSALAFAVAAVAVLLIAFYSDRALNERAQAAQRVTRTLGVLEQFEALLSNLRDAESGQRGYLLTGTESYLEPYLAARAAIPGRFAMLRSLLGQSDRQMARLAGLDRVSGEKLDELAETIARKRAGDSAGALAMVRTERGREAMDRARGLIAEAQADERRLLEVRQRDWEDAAAYSTWVTWSGSALLLVLIAVAAVLAARDHRVAETEAWIGRGEMGLAERIQGERRLAILGEAVLDYLARVLDAQVGALYVRRASDQTAIDLPGATHGDAGCFVRVAGYALAPESADAAVRPGDGLLGQAAKEGRALRVSDVPDGYLRVTSALGSGAARELLVAPAIAEGVVQAVLELGFLRRTDSADRELLDRVCESLGIAVRASIDRGRLETLLDETQTQAEELQAQQEELRVSNEELEEQARALKESQAQLESQQTELEQTNVQLETQAQQLELQHDDLVQAQATLTERANQLERASQYKSEFLANMSHELRTPLNSTLILAKLLADNRSGHLDPEEVRFAQTISDAGNDLLALINDILDLSKVEAGKVEVMIEQVDLGRCIDELMRPLQPIAEQKGLVLNSTLEPGAPARIDTDPQRLGQILKNLLSNALKFTQAGEVSLRVAPAAGGMVTFSVRDTGIGIDSAQHDLIFEAFHQADGSTHRKYGGTGLGLSISRDLAQLLGGDITVRSAPGEGSVFTLTLPSTAAEPAPAGGAVPIVAEPPRPVAFPAVRAAAMSPPPAGAAPTVIPAALIDDDREHLRADARLILVIEDDVRFAAILRDLVHEMDYQCVVTHSASAGLAAASAWRPSAILLDMNLPDHSGLVVLDQLKRNPATRHIPVHVASVADHSKEALELGAVGYALKPVKREQLVDALHRLETKFAQRVRDVLVVEDDARQRDSIRQLLGNAEVRISCVESAAQALDALGRTTFDCMVMDLNLPDLSGFELLEQMSAQDDVAFPPVIVYTGQALRPNEEQRLRRYSKSIIIKDVRSPERLLDEVTLFLHQVETTLPPESQRLLKIARNRDSLLDGRRVLVVEDDVRNIFALSSVLEPKGVRIEIARNGREALDLLGRSNGGRSGAPGGEAVDLVLMDIMMPEMDGYTAMREIRKRKEWQKLPIIALTAKAMKDDQENCLAAGANDYIAKPLDVEKLLSLVRVWMPRS